MSDLLSMLPTETKVFIYNSIIEELSKNRGPAIGLPKEQGHPDYKLNALGKAAPHNGQLEEKDMIYMLVQQLAKEIKKTDIDKNKMLFFKNFQEYSDFVYNKSLKPD
jgi:hypothetical protein